MANAQNLSNSGRYTSDRVIHPKLWVRITEELRLPPRQKEITGLLLMGQSDKQIAESIGIALPTVRTHMRRLFAKLGVQDRAEVTAHVLRRMHGLCCEAKCPFRS